MTCIAWDGATLAADTLCTGPDDNGLFYGTKIWRTKAGLFGGCGDEGPIELALAWMRGGAKPSKRPEPPDGDLGGLLIRPNGTIAILSAKYFLIDYFAGQKVAVGSGGDFAIALMKTGLTAPEAVQRVIDLCLDINTGGKVQTLRLRAKKGR